jgi:hypothetical protein
MNSLDKSNEKQMGGKKRRNGHKYSCKCPICVNMKHAKRGGDNDDRNFNEYEADDKNDMNNMKNDNINDKEIVGSQIAGNKKKSNGHKKMCTCPICKNMKNKSVKNLNIDKEDGLGSNISGGKKKSNGHKKICACPICKNMKKKSLKKLNIDKEDRLGSNIFGGKKKSNGHKKMCVCPICENMKKKQGGDEGVEESLEIEVSPEKEQSPEIVEDNKNEVVADDNEYDDANLSGGTRRRKGGKSKRNSKKSRGNRKTRRNRKRSNRRR